MKKINTICLFFPMIVLAVFCSALPSFAAEITLKWNPVESCDYQVHYGNASRTYTKTVEASETECSISLPPGVYYFAVTAHWKDCKYTLCTSEYSNEVSLMLSEKPEIVTLAFSPER
jgi:hypothetical protein